MRTTPFVLLKKPAWKYVCRGFSYLHKISNFAFSGNRVDADVLGTHLYHVTFFIDFAKMSVFGENCSCPSHTGRKSCKHVAAVITYMENYLNPISIARFGSLQKIIMIFDQIVENTVLSDCGTSLEELADFSKNSVVDFSKGDVKNIIEGLLKKRYITKRKDGLLYCPNPDNKPYEYDPLVYYLHPEFQEYYVKNSNYWYGEQIETYYALPLMKDVLAFSIERGLDITMLASIIFDNQVDGTWYIDAKSSAIELALRESEIPNKNSKVLKREHYDEKRILKSFIDSERNRASFSDIIGDKISSADADKIIQLIDALGLSTKYRHFKRNYLIGLTIEYADKNNIDYWIPYNINEAHSD